MPVRKQPVSAPAQRKHAGYGWRPDLPDARDYLLVQEPRVSPPRPFVDLSKSSAMPPVYDQGELGSCTANALGALLQFDRRRQKLKDFVPSRLMIYFSEREIEGTINSDAGAELRDGLKALAKIGACPETQWPYVISKFAMRPPQFCYAAAKTDAAKIYARVPQTLANLCRCLADGFPFAFGFSVYESFESDMVAKTGIMPMPAPHEQLIGGHAVLAVGYDDNAAQFIVRNSWGKSWGQRGYFRMPYAFVLDPRRASDFWTIRSVG